MRRWFDGLHDIYEGKNEIEIKLGLFGGDGGEGGGGTPTEGTNAINRGTVGLTAAEMNARADAQERGGRQSAGVAGPSSRQDFSRSPSNFGAMSPEEIASEAMASSSDRFTTSTEGAYRDLDRRADVGQINPSIGVIETPFGNIRTPTSAALGAVNRFGMSRAQDIRNQLNTGGSPITDRYGRIQGVVSEGTGPLADLLGSFGQNKNVYTGGSSFAPSTAQLMSYRPDPTRQGIASLPYADVQMPTTTRAQPLSQPVSESKILENGTTITPMSNGMNEITLPDGRKTTQNADGTINSFSSFDLYSPSALRGNLTPTELERLQNTSLSPQLGTVDDPTAQAGLYEDLKSGIGNLFGTSPARAGGYSKPIGKGGVARQYFTAPGKDVRRPFRGSETGFKEFFSNLVS